MTKITEKLMCGFLTNNKETTEEIVIELLQIQYPEHKIINELTSIAAWSKEALECEEGISSAGVFKHLYVGAEKRILEEYELACTLSAKLYSNRLKKARNKGNWKEIKKKLENIDLLDALPILFEKGDC